MAHFLLLLASKEKFESKRKLGEAKQKEWEQESWTHNSQKWRLTNPPKRVPRTQGSKIISSLRKKQQIL
jgi:hypothetical protein